MSLTLLAAALSLGIWVTFTFVLPAGLGIVHVLFGLGVALLIRWWAQRSGPEGPATRS